MAFEVILFEHPGFKGAHKHLFVDEPNLDAGDDDFFNDKVSSIAVLDGHWQFFRDAGFLNPFPTVLGPGLYSFVEGFGIQDDAISSVRSLGTGGGGIFGDPILGHVILFEHDVFRGPHKHILWAEPNLDDPQDNYFNDKTSSLAVLSGSWAFFRHAHFAAQYPAVLGPGLYPFAPTAQIEDDALSSLRPEPGGAEGVEPLGGHTVLFEHRNFHGSHRHILRAEPNLDDSFDDTLNDRVSSMAILDGVWAFYQDKDFERPYDQIRIGPGLYPWVPVVGITNDDMSSLEPVGLTVGYSGTATFTVQHPDIPGPVQQQFSVTLVLDRPHRTARFDSFPDFSLGPFPTVAGADTITVSLIGRAGGNLNAKAGRMSLPCHFHLDHSLIVAGDSDTDMSLETRVPIDLTGHMVLEGDSMLQGGYLNGKPCNLRMDGFLGLWPLP